MPWYGIGSIAGISLFIVATCLTYFARQNTLFALRIDEMREDSDRRFDEKTRAFEERMDRKDEELHEAIRRFNETATQFNDTIVRIVTPMLETLNNIKDGINFHSTTWSEDVRDEYRLAFNNILDSLRRQSEALCMICARLEIEGKPWNGKERRKES